MAYNHHIYKPKICGIRMQYFMAYNHHIYIDYFMYLGGPKSVVQCPKDMETNSTKKEI